MNWVIARNSGGLQRSTTKGFLGAALWLDERTRLAAPSQQDAQTLIGPRVVLVDVSVMAISWIEVSNQVERRLREISVFLTVVMGYNFTVPVQGRGWTISTDGTRSKARSLGYRERSWLGGANKQPVRHALPPVELYEVKRPDRVLRGVDGTTLDLKLPSDIRALWNDFSHLEPNLKRRFLEAGMVYQAAGKLRGEYETTAFALTVAACEALKPLGNGFRGVEARDVVAALLNEPTGEAFEDTIGAQAVRNANLHAAEMQGSELDGWGGISTYVDPTFRMQQMALNEIVHMTIIEWLRRRGSYKIGRRPYPPK